MARICIIPARGGSKRIPRKNIREFLGKPILAYSIEAATSSGIFDEVVVSTDDPEIAEIATRHGASVPFLRSEANSTDMAMTVPVLLEVLDRFEERGRSFSTTCCLYPTAPFITSQRLVEGCGILESRDADSAIPVVRFSYPIQRSMHILAGTLEMLWPENYNKRSQDLEPIYHDAGQFYFVKTMTLREQVRLFCGITVPIILKEAEVQDIDTLEDWEIAEWKFRWRVEKDRA